MRPRAPRCARRLLAVCVVAGGCVARPEPCQSPPDCDEGYECLAFRCVPPGGNPVPPASERHLLLPRALGADGEAELAGSIDLGPPRHHALYVQFTLPEASCSRLSSAFLLLDTAEQGQPLPSAVAVTVRRIRESWNAGSLGAGQTPEDSVPEAAGWLTPRRTARIDVTSVVCNALDTVEPSHGLVVRSDADVPLRVATGVDSAAPPRLELYLLPARSTAPPKEP